MMNVIIYKIGEISEPISDTSTLTRLDVLAPEENAEDTFQILVNEVSTKSYFDYSMGKDREDVDFYNIFRRLIPDSIIGVENQLEKYSYPIDLSIPRDWDDIEASAILKEIKIDLEDNGVYFGYVRDDIHAMGFFPFVFRYPFLSTENALATNKVGFFYIYTENTPQ